jgi:hypothetical protein
LSKKWRMSVIILYIIMWIYNPFCLFLYDQEFWWDLIAICSIRYSDEWEVILTFKNQVNQEWLNIKLPSIFCCHFKFLPRPFVIYFCACLCIHWLQSRRLIFYTHAQCAAVKTHSELMREPPQKYVPLIIRATCHGNWPRDAVLPPVVRWLVHSGTHGLFQRTLQHTQTHLNAAKQTVCKSRH